MPQQIQILVAEDNPIDQRAMSHALEALTVDCVVSVVGDGAAALAYLGDPGSRRPDLVLLDLNLPGVDGHDVLAALRTEPSAAPVPVIVLTTSEAENDVRHAYEAGANAFITKPTTLADWHVVMHAVESFWFSVATLLPR